MTVGSENSDSEGLITLSPGKTTSASSPYNILNKKNLENYKKSGKIYVSKIEKIIQTLFSVFDLIKLSLISKNDDNINHDHNLINEEINLNERI